MLVDATPTPADLAAHLRETLVHLEAERVRADAATVMLRDAYILLARTQARPEYQTDNGTHLFLLELRAALVLALGPRRTATGKGDK